MINASFITFLLHPELKYVLHVFVDKQSDAYYTCWTDFFVASNMNFMQLQILHYYVYLFKNHVEFVSVYKVKRFHHSEYIFNLIRGCS